MTLREVAEELVGLLTPACERIEIAGSIRRGKPNPKDIEVVAIPKLVPVTDMFGIVVPMPETNLLETCIEGVCEGDWAYDAVHKRNGPRYKRLRHVSGIACDLFITDSRRWGVIYTLRTGPSEFSQALVTLARKQGKRVNDGLLHNHRFIWNMTRDAEVPCDKGERCPLIIPTPEEIDFFTALGVRFLEPSQRTPEAITNL